MAKKLTFEEKMQRLDGIVRQLEEGSLELAASLKLYGEGVKLAKECSSELDKARQQVMMLVREETSGEMQQQPFAEE
ncbi:MAG: exodeoxyribonuclease VII small subunit [Eubacteriales bacterium]|jgi:exodeoxyribonuclease VII small subunit